MDEVLCCLQGPSEEAKVVGFRPLSMRMGVVGTRISQGPGSTETEENETRTEGRRIAMAKVIEFYIPSNFQKRMPSIPPKHRGKVIEFCATKTKTKTA